MGVTNVWGITGNWAEIYHTCFVPTIIVPWVERTLALAAPQPGKPQHAAKLNPPHSLSDPAEVGRLLQEAGFGQIDVKAEAARARFASPQALLCGFGALSGPEADAGLRDALCDRTTLLQRVAKGRRLLARRTPLTLLA